MIKKSLATIGLAVAVMAFEPPLANAGIPYDVAGARARARAGGPISSYDAYLLDQYGALSGTPGFDRSGTYRLKRNRKYRKRYYKRRYQKKRWRRRW